jgi:predicted RNase H-like HicB family nuclease
MSENADVKTDAARYLKVVLWSEDDGAFVGLCPGVIGACCHGADEVEVYRELCQIVEEWVELARLDGRPLPPPTVGGLATASDQDLLKIVRQIGHPVEWPR